LARKTKREDKDEREDMEKQDAIQQAIDRLFTAIPQLDGVLLASTDGLPIAHSFSTGGDPNRVAAMAAAALGLGKRIGETFNSGMLTELSVRGTEGQMFLYAAGSKGVLALTVPVSANIGMIHIAARHAARRIAEVL
jgi:hypothetical protein